MFGSKQQRKVLLKQFNQKQENLSDQISLLSVSSRFIKLITATPLNESKHDGVHPHGFPRLITRTKCGCRTIAMIYNSEVT